MVDLKRRAKHSDFHYTGGEGDHCWNAHHSSSLLGIEVILLLELSWQLNSAQIYNMCTTYTICLQLYNIYNMCTKCNMCSGSLQLCNSSKVSSEIFEPWSVDGLKPWLSNCQKGGKYIYLSPLRSQGIRFESLMEERKMLLGTGCQDKSHGLRIGTVKSRMIWRLLWMVSDQCCQFCEKKQITCLTL